MTNWSGSASVSRAPARRSRCKTWGVSTGPTIDAPTVDDIDVAFGAVYAEPGNSEDAHWTSLPSLRSARPRGRRRVLRVAAAVGAAAAIGSVLSLGASRGSGTRPSTVPPLGPSIVPPGCTNAPAAVIAFLNTGMNTSGPRVTSGGMVRVVPPVDSVQWAVASPLDPGTEPTGDLDYIVVGIDDPAAPTQARALNLYTDGITNWPGHTSTIDALQVQAAAAARCIGRHP